MQGVAEAPELLDGLLSPGDDDRIEPEQQPGRGRGDRLEIEPA